MIATGDIFGDVVAQGHNIANVQSTSGGISGLISASAGTVVQVQALVGTISGTISSNRGMITLIKGKNITATITANGQLQATAHYFAIDTIQATEDIGTSDQLATITTDAGPISNPNPPADPGFYNGGIKKILGRNIFANITTPTPGDSPLAPYSADHRRGDIRELNTTGTLAAGTGRFVGTVTTFSFGDPALLLTETIKIGGNLEGVINGQGTIKSPVKISGSILQGGVLALVGADQDLSPSGDITITGALAGTISIAGDKFGDLKITPGSTTGTIHVGGNLESKLTIGGTVASTARIVIDGDVKPLFNNAQPPVQLDTIVLTGGSAMAGKLWIGHSLLGVVIMPPPSAGGLAGQVIINRNDGDGVFDSSTARVRVGQTNQTGWLNIAQAEYPLLSSQIGGGAVGLVPFKLHKEDCAPPYSDNPTTPGVLTSAFLPTETRPTNLAAARITMRSRGPMKIDSASGYIPDTAIVIEVQNPSCPTQWSAADSFFTKTPPSGNRRVVELTRVTSGLVPKDGIYRVIPRGLICADLNLTGDDDMEPVVWPNTYLGSGGVGAYVFRVGADCNGNGIWDINDIANGRAASPAVDLDTNNNGVLDSCEIGGGATCRCDWNLTGVVSVQDIFDFLACFFSGVGDFNNSGATTVQDLFDFLACYFALPPPCCPQGDHTCGG